MLNTNNFNFKTLTNDYILCYLCKYQLPRHFVIYLLVYEIMYKINCTYNIIIMYDYSSIKDYAILCRYLTIINI